MTTEPRASRANRRLLAWLYGTAIGVGLCTLVLRLVVAQRQGGIEFALLGIAIGLLIIPAVFVPFRYGVSFRRRAINARSVAFTTDVLTPWKTYATIAANAHGLVLYGGYRRLITRQVIPRATIVSIDVEARPAGARLLQSLVIRTQDGHRTELVLMTWGRFWFHTVPAEPARLTADSIKEALGRAA